MPQPISADFVEIKTVNTRAMVKLIFEIPCQVADEALRALGGIPQPGTNRICGIVLLEEP